MHRDDFLSYIKAYLECANYLKWYMKKESDLENMGCKEELFLPMCYLYRNCIELNLKMIWFQETGEDFQTKCKIMLDKKHSIVGLWKKLKPYILNCTVETAKREYLDGVQDYCMQVHKIDSDASKFRYPMTNTMQPYFSENKRFDFTNTGDFFEALNNILDEIDSDLDVVKQIRAEKS